MEFHTRLFVGNLPDDTNENDLKTAFTSFGEIKTLDLKSKSADDENKKNFAFVTLSASNCLVESCIKHFSSQDFNGKRLYVTRARESFLERLQREREQAKKAPGNKHHHEKATKNPVIKLGDKLNPRKRKVETNHPTKIDHNGVDQKFPKKHEIHRTLETPPGDNKKHKVSAVSEITDTNKTKKQVSDKKRMESMKKKRQEFKEKQMIIKTGLIGIDKIQNKKVIFAEDDSVVIKPQKIHSHKNNDSNNVTNHKKRGNTLFDDDDSGDEVNFKIKEQFEGKKGQKVLDLQSKYKSDKRFVLDERFMEEESDGEKDENHSVEEDNIELGQTDEKAKQINILQDVLGVTIKTNYGDQANNKKAKTKLGMLRFDPSQPEHAKFFAPVEEKQEQTTKNSKKKKSKEKPVDDATPTIPEPEVPKVEVSKEQFYKVSEALKEAIVQPTTFSLRSLFGTNDENTNKDESTEQDTGYIPLVKSKEPKVKNPLNPSEKNPFMYDSSDSESEDEQEKQTNKEPLGEITEVKAVWKENLFFSKSDYRFKEGLAFFNKVNEDGQKERRELKSLMKKRMYNNTRKSQMFQKKIGGKKKTMKKSYNNKKKR